MIRVTMFVTHKALSYW